MQLDCTSTESFVMQTITRKYKEMIKLYKLQLYRTTNGQHRNIPGALQLLC